VKFTPLSSGAAREIGGYTPQQVTSTVGAPVFAAYNDPQFGQVIAPNFDGGDVVYFGGGDGSGPAPFKPFPFLAELTVCAWLYMPTAAGDGTHDGYHGLIASGYIFSTDCNFVFGVRTSSSLRRPFIYARSAGSLLGVEAGFAGMNTGVWYRLVGTWKPGSQELFVNGATTTEVGSASGNNSPGYPLTFGSPYDAASDARWFGGAFDLRVYNRVWSKVEVAEDYWNFVDRYALFAPRRQMRVYSSGAVSPTIGTGRNFGVVMG